MAEVNPATPLPIIKTFTLSISFYVFVISHSVAPPTWHRRHLEPTTPRVGPARQYDPRR